ncbi:MAG TPA: SAM-dependent methyltransferase [Marmoricola sp.]|nr:SAM-dependent methyltransferase [Marmoricola sp.]
MPEPLEPALDRLRTLIGDRGTLVRAIAAGRRRGARPAWRRVELRYVDLKAGRRLQVVKYDESQAHTSNHEDTDAVLDDLFAQPFGNWHVETTDRTVQLRVTKKGEAVVSVQDTTRDVPGSRDHDRPKDRLLPEDDPVLVELGISHAQGRVKPTRRAKYRQVEEFVRLLSAALDEALESGRLAPTPDRPLRVVDLGCGNAYLTFAAHAWLSRVRGLPVRIVGVDVKEQSREHNTAVARRLGVADELSFVVGGIDSVEVDPPDVVLALHACDTATDDALARGVEWEAPLVLAAPCCHHDISAQLRRQPAPEGYGMLTRDGILRERLADTLTDALRASILRSRGYRVDVVEFVGSEHTPRNTLLRAVHTGQPSAAAQEEYDDLVAAWRLRPKLADLLGAGP